MDIAGWITVLGLLLDLGGAILLIGKDWRYTTKLGFALRPKFEHLDNGLFRVGNKRQELTPDDPEFQALFDLVEPLRSFRDTPSSDIQPTKILPPTEKTDERVVFIKEDLNSPPNANYKSQSNFEIDLLEKIAENKFQSWFIRLGAGLLGFGFALQILAQFLG